MKKIYLKPQTELLSFNQTENLLQASVSKLNNEAGFNEEILPGSGEGRSRSYIWDDENEEEFF